MGGSEFNFDRTSRTPQSASEGRMSQRRLTLVVHDAGGDSRCLMEP